MPYLELEQHPDCIKLMALAATLGRGEKEGEYLAAKAAEKNGKA